MKKVLGYALFTVLFYSAWIVGAYAVAVLNGFGFVESFGRLGAAIAIILGLAFIVKMVIQEHSYWD
jgi:hypothetical protein